IVAASVLTTFLTPYIMKAAMPCYNYLYNHASPRLKAKIDTREKQVEEAEKAAADNADKQAQNPSSADKVRHAVRKTLVTKHVVDLFLKNMSENDEPDNA
ncbi:MAG: hypothetical protein IKR37_05035, partial [Paludibacteraceae bacterium]|nr:hypothetical protein [Paludibacteraceae bacterium]